MTLWRRIMTITTRIEKLALAIKKLESIKQAAFQDKLLNKLDK